MNYIIKENNWLIGMDHGFGNGYVVIPKGHPYHGQDYDNIPVDVHGDLTFAEPASGLEWKELQPEDKEGWVVGFDTSHWGDTSVNWSESEVVKETIRLRDQLLAVK